VLRSTPDRAPGDPPPIDLAHRGRRAAAPIHATPAGGLHRQDCLRTIYGVAGEARRAGFGLAIDSFRHVLAFGYQAQIAGRASRPSFLAALAGALLSPHPRRLAPELRKRPILGPNELVTMTRRARGIGSRPYSRRLHNGLFFAQKTKKGGVRP